MTRRKRLRFQNRLLVLSLLAVAPSAVAAVVLLWITVESPPLRWTLLSLLGISTLIALVALRRHVVRPLQALANMLEALREGDYSMRGRNVNPEDSFGEVMVEVNTLSRTLYDQRLEALEAGALLQKIIADVDIAVFAFDAALRLRIVNKAGETLLRGTSETLQGRSAAELGLDGMLAEESGRIVGHVFPGGGGRWEIRRRSFREGGKPHRLIVVDPADDDGVDLHGLQARLDRRVDAVDDLRQFIAPGEEREALGLERIEADGDAPEPGFL